jgi:hypothetical protein
MHKTCKKKTEANLIKCQDLDLEEVMDGFPGTNQT